jgi:hypothetical protein
LLPVPYYHVVFTLPAPISAIAYTNKEMIYGLLFDIAAETLRTIAADPKHLGARIGTTLVLHTWGSALTHHPHVHGIVPGGGLAPDADRWVPCKPGFFLSVRVLSRLFDAASSKNLQNLHRDGQLKFFGEHVDLADPSPSPTGSCRCVSASGWSTPSAPSPDPSRCSPICRATPTGWRSPTHGSSPTMNAASRSAGRTTASTAARAQNHDR